MFFVSKLLSLQWLVLCYYIFYIYYLLYLVKQLLLNVNRQQMQAKMVKRAGFANTASGNANAKFSKHSKKQLDLDDFDVQMLSPNFLQGKTLKKPFNESDIHLKKTNPYGTRFEVPQKDEQYYSMQLQQNQNKNNEKIKRHQKQKVATSNELMDYKFISAQNLNIRPANKKHQQDKQFVLFRQPMQLQFELKDKNSVISALFRKGQLNKNIDEIKPIQIKISKPVETVAKAGPAQTKLKSLFNKNDNKLTVNTGMKKQKQTKKQQQIDEEIQESIEQDYGNESFEKISGAFQSQIKQSIRQSIGASSGVIKESIRQSIRQSLRQSIKDQVGESGRSHHSKSKEQIKEDIMESIHKESIQEQVYEEIFQDASISDEISKSKSNKNFKKTKQEDKFQISVSASKGFRTKTNSIAKSIRFAQQLTIQNQIKNVNNKLQQRIVKGDKIAEQVIKQRSNFEKLKQKITSLLQKQTGKSRKPEENKNLDLLRHFKIQINRLITSENFMSKLRRLTAFMNNSANQTGSGPKVEQLQDKLLKNVFQKVEHLKVSGVTQQQLTKVKKQYEDKIQYLLKEQQMKLRVEMDKKIHEKDMELKKMIAQLEQKFSQRVPISQFYQQIPKKNIHGDRVQVDSDYSIQSQDVSWKMDLWQLLPDYEKKKLYQKQGAEVARFLTEVLMNQIKNQNLDRSADISFEFPQQYNISNDEDQYRNIKMSRNENNSMKPIIDRQQLRKQIGKENAKSQMFPPLPGMKKASAQDSSGHPFMTNINYLDVPIRLQSENSVRDTLSTTEVVKILSKYKNLFLRKKNDVIKRLVKTLQSKQRQNQPLSSLIHQIRVINDTEIAEKDKQKQLAYIRAYEQELIMQLISIYNRMKNRKTATIQQEMKKMYDRLVITCQIKTAESSLGFPKDVIPNQTYMNLKMEKEDRKIKDALATQICNILALEFAKQMPKRRK